MNFAKYTFNAGLQIAKHCERDRGPNCRFGNISIDVTRSYLNKTIDGVLTEDGEKVPLLPYTETVKLLKGITEKETGRAMQATANTLVSCVLTLPKEYQAPKGVPFKEWYTAERRKKEDELWRAVFQFLKKRFVSFFKKDKGKKFSNLVFYTIHRDETAPHAHFGFVPVLKETRTVEKSYTGKDGNRKTRTVCSKAGTICANEVITRDLLTGLHQEMDEHLKASVAWYKGGVLLSEEERLRKGQNVTLKELKALPEDFRQERAAFNRLDALVAAVGDLRGKQAEIEAIKKELEELSRPENFPPVVRLVHQLSKDRKLTTADFVGNAAYKEAIETYKEYKETLRGVRVKIKKLTKNGRGRDD